MTHLASVAVLQCMGLFAAFPSLPATSRSGPFLRFVLDTTNVHTRPALLASPWALPLSERPTCLHASSPRLHQAPPPSPLTSMHVLQLLPVLLPDLLSIIQNTEQYGNGVQRRALRVLHCCIANLSDMEMELAAATRNVMLPLLPPWFEQFACLMSRPMSGEVSGDRALRRQPRGRRRAVGGGCGRGVGGLDMWASRSGRRLTRGLMPMRTGLGGLGDSYGGAQDPGHFDHLLWEGHRCLRAGRSGAVLGHVCSVVRTCPATRPLTCCAEFTELMPTPSAHAVLSLPIYESKVVSEDGDIDDGELDSDGENLDFETLISQLFELLLVLVGGSRLTDQAAAKEPTI